MKNRRVSGKRKERYCITIASQTDANKKVRSLTASRAAIAAFLACVALILLLSAGIAVFSVRYMNRCEAKVLLLSGEAGRQSAMLDYYTAQLAMRQQGVAAAGGAEESAADAGAVLAEDAQEASERIAAEDTSVAIPVQDAVAEINESFISGLGEQIGIAKLGKPADQTEVVYSGEFEGDSDTVNNWADVLAVFAVLHGYELSALQTVSGDEYAQLEQIYDEMNRVAIRCEIANLEDSGTADAQDGAAMAPKTASTKLTLCVTIESLSCMEYALAMGWDDTRKESLETLMSPDYYLTFAALLGVDLYDGLNSEALSDIIARLEPGSVSATIVETALTRVGDPYSRGRRGSGDYVDCSYFVCWSYAQAGVAIPASSVEQARYCYYNGYEVGFNDLKPGDLLFWSRTSCHCGRWHEIHHAGIYLGDGMIIDASSSKGCVVIRSLWGTGGGEWRLFMCARPYTEETPAV
jgi:cell wall-associated NlpC family hydrolase